MDLEEQLRGWIVEYKERKGISQAEIANRSGLSRSTICLYFKGKRNGSIRTVERIADALGLKLSVYGTTEQ